MCLPWITEVDSVGGYRSKVRGPHLSPVGPKDVHCSSPGSWTQTSVCAWLISVLLFYEATTRQFVTAVCM